MYCEAAGTKLYVMDVTLAWQHTFQKGFVLAAARMRQNLDRGRRSRSPLKIGS
jgi:hypothetical protein